MNAILKLCAACICLALVGMVSEARAADWTLMLKNTGTVEDSRTINGFLGDGVPSIVRLNCVPGDRYALYLKAGSRPLDVLVKNYISLYHYLKSAGLKIEVQFVGGKSWKGVKAGSETLL